MKQNKNEIHKLLHSIFPGIFIKMKKPEKILKGVSFKTGGLQGGNRK